MKTRYIYLLILGISLLVAFYFVRSTLSLYSAKNTLAIAQKKLTDLKSENIQIKNEIEYRKTDDYVINEARGKLNYGFKGETIVILPKIEEDALKSTPKLAKVADKAGIDSNLTKSDSSTLSMWFDAFF